jgi:hypothetical protein
MRNTAIDAWGVSCSDPLFEPRQVHACRDQQAPELIVQLARQGGLLLLRHRLQMRRELRKLLGALLDQALELALARRELLGLALIGAQLAQRQVAQQQQQTRARHQRRAGRGDAAPAVHLPAVAGLDSLGIVECLDLERQLVDL